MRDSDDNEEDVRDVSKAGIDQMPTAAQMARHRNYCRNPQEIQLRPKVADFDVLSGNQADMCSLLTLFLLI